MFGKIFEIYVPKGTGRVIIHLILDRSNINYKEIFRFLKMLIP